jgi:hypothetical protein
MKEITKCPICRGSVSVIPDKNGKTIICDRSKLKDKDERCPWSGEKILDKAKELGDRKNKKF